MPTRRPATSTEYDNMCALHREWYLNGVPILMTAKNGIVRGMIASNAMGSITAGQGPHWSLAEADAILVRPQGYRDRESDNPRLALIHQPDYVNPDTVSDLSAYLMITTVGVAIKHHETDPAGAQRILDALSPGERWQVEARFADVASICQHRLAAQAQPPRQGNCVAIETFVSRDRCLRQSPDGRGAIWLFSGGDQSAYGACTLSNCPLARSEA